MSQNSKFGHLKIHLFFKMVDENSRRSIAYSFLVIFGNGDTIAADELAMLKRLALENGVVDEGGEVLASIFTRVSKKVMDSVWSEIQSFIEKFGIE